MLDSDTAPLLCPFAELTAGPMCTATLRNALTFGWSSVTGNLEPDRIRVMDRFVEGCSVVDVGCGGGGYADYLESRGVRAVRFDLSHELLKFSREPGRTGRGICGDVLHMPFKDNCFDTALAFDILEHVDDAAALTELVRVSRRRVIAALPLQVDPTILRYGLVYSHYQDPTHLRYYTEESARAVFEKMGLDVIHLEKVLEVDVLALAGELSKRSRHLGWLKFSLIELLRRLHFVRRVSTGMLLVAELRK